MCFFLKKWTQYFWKTLLLFGHQCWSEVITLRERRDFSETERSPDGLCYKGDFPTRGRGADLVHIYEPQSCPSIQDVASGCMRSLGRVKTLPKPGTNHYITTQGDDRPDTVALSSSLSLSLSLSFSLSKTKWTHFQTTTRIEDYHLKSCLERITFSALF